MAVKVDLNISLDGFATTTDQTPENPFGDDWQRLVAAYVGTRTFRERVMGDTSGAGTTGVDEKYASTYFEGTGSEIMGAGMFGLHQNADDPDWRGWWGDEPPFRVPVFVLTHHPRASIAFDNGTVFHFLDASPQDALARAVDAADGGDVRIGGGADVVRQFLRAGLVDRIHFAVAPIVLGRGQRIWDGLRGLETGYEVTSEVAESGTTHLSFRR
jgi:dihydrofolate reductase